MDSTAGKTALRSPNFGFLASLAPLLAVDGMAAESYVYTDPDAAMVMARRFTETLAKELLVRTRTRMNTGGQRERIRTLAEAGVLVQEIRDAFDRVRRTGNRAAHGRFGDVRAAVEAVRTCFELGVWFHRAVTGDPTPRAFVPPADPEPDQAELSDVDRIQLDALHDDLDRHRRRLAEVLMPVEPAGDASRYPAEILARANADRERLGEVATHLGHQLAEVERAFNDKVTMPQTAVESDRDMVIGPARVAARWLADVACSAAVRALGDRVLLDVATWTGPQGQTLMVTHTSNGGYRFTGTLHPEMSVEDQPWADRTSLMCVLADFERDGYRPANDEGTRVIRAMLLIPGALDFRSAAEVIAPPACPPWCVTDHSRYVDWLHECQGPSIELLDPDGRPISAEPIQLTDACTGEVHRPLVRIGDSCLDAATARRLAAGILASAALVDKL